MKNVTSREIVNVIHNLGVNNLDSGIKLIEDYGKEQFELGVKKGKEFEIIDIYDKLEPYVNDEVKDFWKDEQPLILNTVTACMGVVVERTIYDTKENIEAGVLNSEYIIFGALISRAASLGLIKYGVTKGPCMIKLAVISPSQRYMLCFCPKTDKSVNELKMISNVFLHEGELAPLISDIYKNF